jgi:hypothetical protein
MARILIEEGKHGTTNYDVATDFKLGLVCLNILAERNKDGWYDPCLSDAEKPDFEEEAISSMPSSMKANARKKWVRYKADVAANAEASAWQTKLNALLDSQECPSVLAERAWNMLWDRSHQEYEGVELQETCNPAEFKVSLKAEGNKDIKPGTYIVIKAAGVSFLKYNCVKVYGEPGSQMVSCAAADNAGLELTKSGIQVMERVPAC